MVSKALLSLLQLTDTSKPPTALECPASPRLLLHTLSASAWSAVSLWSTKNPGHMLPKACPARPQILAFSRNTHPHTRCGNSSTPVSKHEPGHAGSSRDNAGAHSVTALMFFWEDFVQQMGRPLQKRILSHKVHKGLKLIPISEWQHLIVASRFWGSFSLQMFTKQRTANQDLVLGPYLRVNPCQSRAFSKYFELRNYPLKGLLWGTPTMIGWQCRAESHREF